MRQPLFIKNICFIGGYTILSRYLHKKDNKEEES